MLTVKTFLIAFGFGSALLLSACGATDAFKAESEESEGSSRRNDAAGNAGSDDKASDDDDDSVSSKASKQLVVEGRSGDVAFDLLVVRHVVGSSSIFASTQGSRIGISDVYHGASVAIEMPAAGTAVAVQGWAIASKSQEKAWMQTTCKPQTPGADGAVIDLCELAGPFIEAQAEIANLSGDADSDDVLAVLMQRFPDEEFAIAAAGEAALTANGSQHQEERLTLSVQ